STEFGRVMDERLPAPWNFNHTIVQLKFRDSLHYIDPTISFQRGNLKNIVTPDYYFGVVADKNQPGLTRITEKKNTSVIRAKEDFSFDEVGGMATLLVETYYSGEEADGIRSSFKSNLKSETDQNYLDFYANDFPTIRLAKSVTFDDDPVTNSIKVFEEYEIPDFWQYDSANSQYTADIYGRVISGYIERPSTKIRKSPFYVRYPLDAELVTNVHLPESWGVTERKGDVKGPGFAFTYDWSYPDERLIRLKYTMLHSSPHIEASKTADYLKKIDNVYNELSFRLTYTPGTAEVNKNTGSKFSLGVFTIVALIGVAFYVLFAQLNRFDPRSKQHSERHDQIGSWLVVLAFGLAITPIRILILLFDTYILNPKIWEGIINFSGDSTLSFWLIVEVFFNSTLLALSVFCAYLFFNRRTSAPLFITIMLGVGLLFQGLIALETQFFENSEIDVKQILVAVIGAAIWIPYLHLSERSKGTFIRRFDKKWFSE
ncbi:MAG TPA: DUF2569 domain-containing protein, partial [Cyclobacteriaceae bacterium]|nr:DUF2569 domain-containing protein [Cyclobacteriaceae bacterium]